MVRQLYGKRHAIHMSTGQDVRTNKHITVQKVESQQGTSVQHGNSTQHFVIAQKGKELKREYMCVCLCVCVYMNHFALNLKLTQQYFNLKKCLGKQKKKKKIRSNNSIACWIKHFECLQVIFLKNIIIKWNYAFIPLIFHKRIVQAFLCIMCY